MTEPPESRTESTTVTREPRYGDRYDRPNRLNQALAWVGIVVGVTFIVGMVFFSGLFIGARAGYGWDRDDRDGPSWPACDRSQMGPGMMGPGMMGPGGSMGPGQPQSPTTTAPATPRP